MGIVHVPEARRLFAEMTVEENLDMGSLKGEAKKQAGRDQRVVFDLFPRLMERKKTACRNLERRRAADACRRKGTDGKTQAADV